MNSDDGIPMLKWNLDEDISEEDLSLLTEMRTDIVIENIEYLKLDNIL